MRPRAGPLAPPAARPRLHRVLRRPLPLDRHDVAPHDRRDLPEPLRAADPRRTGRTTTGPGPSSATRPTSATARSSPCVSVALVTVLGSMAAFAFARRRYAFPGREPLFLLIFLSVMFPPQIMLLALFQILVQYKLFNTLTGLILVYVVTELPLTIYLLRAFFAQIPTRAGGGGADRRLRRLADVLAGHAPDRAPGGRHDGHPELHLLLERVPVRRRLHHAAAAPDPARSRSSSW